MGYDILTLMKPIGAGNKVYDEQILFTPDPKTGKILPCRLLFEPKKIISVRSYYLNMEYKEGIDYEIKDGMICLLEQGAMPYFSYDEFYLASPSSIPIESVSVPGRYVRFEDNGIETYKRTVYVTYTHCSQWPFQTLAKRELKLSRSIEKLRKGQPLHILFYGDSIGCGCDSSGRSGMEPFYPTYDKLIVEKLSHEYHDPWIRFTNSAVGGKDTEWGLAEAEKRVVEYHPDLIFLRFGMNDGSRKMPAEVYADNLNAIVQRIRMELPEAEFILMGTELPNPDCKGWTGTQDEFQEAMKWVEKEQGCAFVKILDLYKWIVQRKGYPSIGSNFVNHPNDFLIRIYAQLIVNELGIVE